MNRSILNAINVSLDGYSILISLIIVISVFSIKNIEKSARTFAITNIMAIVYGLTDLIMWISEGTDAAWKMIVLPVSTFLFYLSGILIFLFYIKYVLEYYDSVQKLNKKWWYFTITIIVLYIICICITPATGFFYIIDENNVYHRGNVFVVSVGFELILYLEVLLLVLKFHKRMSNSENIGFASFIFCPFIAQIVQIANYGIALNSLGLTISFFIIYIYMNQRIKTKLNKTELELNVLDNKKTEILNNTIRNLATLIEFNEIGSNHLKRISSYSVLLAQACKKNGLYDDIINEEYITIIGKTSVLHDIGNITIKRPLLKKPSKLTPEEFETIKPHAEIGSHLVDDVLAVGFERIFIKMASDICKCHHERWDGKGYPNHLVGKEIPLCARIVAIADVYDALVTPRCYKNTVSFDEAFTIIDNESGKHFDPELVMEFKKIKEKIIEITKKYCDSSYED